MHEVVIRYDKRKDAERGADRLWKRGHLRGEVHIKPSGEAWLLEVYSERNLRPDTIAALGGSVQGESA